MRTKSAEALTKRQLLDEEIRDYAYHLYEQNGCVPGHDLERWLETKACILANIPRQDARNRLHHEHAPLVLRVNVCRKPNR